MTRNRELDCEDLFGCSHEPETPVMGDGGEIEYWVCRCGRRCKTEDVVEKPTEPQKPP